MSLTLTPEILSAAYDYLAGTEPFNKWNLPPSDEVLFVVNRSRKYYGDYHWDGDRHVIRISSHFNRRTDTLMRTCAHEICHLVEEHAGFSRSDVQHSMAFQKLAKQVCKAHGFDEAVF